MKLGVVSTSSLDENPPRQHPATPLLELSTVPALPTDELLTSDSLETTPETIPETTRGLSPEALGPSPLGPRAQGQGPLGPRSYWRRSESLWRRSSGRLGSRCGGRLERVGS